MKTEYYKLTISHETAYDAGGPSGGIIKNSKKVLDVTYKTFRGAKNRAMREAKALAKEHDFDRFWRKILWSDNNPGLGFVGDYVFGVNYAKIRISKFAKVPGAITVRRRLKTKK